ncbi:MAG: hypothetical protein IJV88_04275 [Ruminococcus sp.]|nr:hypothetical protein [Ruminococcus sp.]
MKRQFAQILSMIMVFAMILSMFCMGVSANTDVDTDIPTDVVSSADEYLIGIIGDADTNGKVDVRDATTIQKEVAMLIQLGEERVLADVNGDEDITVRDATEIQKWVALMSNNELIGTELYAKVPVEPTQPVVTVPVVTVTVVTDPVVSDPVVSDPVVSDPVVTDPVVSDPVVSDPVVTDPVVSDPVVSDPVVSDPVVSDPVVSDPVVSDPVVSEPVVTEPVATITITFYSEGCAWVQDYASGVNLIDVDTDTTYIMTKDPEAIIWTVDVPETVTNIRFDRETEGVVYNAWSAGDRGDMVIYAPTGDGVGSWIDKIPEVSNDIIIYFDNSVTQWNYVAFYQWNDASFGSYHVMNQVEGTDIWYITINSKITTGLFKGNGDGVWDDFLQTNDIKIDIETDGNRILFTPEQGASKWNTYSSAYAG